MKKIILLVCICLLVLSNSVFSQETTEATRIGADTAQQNLKEISVAKFEDAGFWVTSMPRDQGLIYLRRQPGSPKDKEPITGEEEAGIEEEDKYVMAAKVYFYKRGFNEFGIYPVRPIPVEGVTKTLSVWVVGRNVKHTIKILISDAFGKRSEITLGVLNFSGWRRLTTAIPPNIVQRDYHYGNKAGIKIHGFKIETDPMESYGQYYIYFDGLTANTDLFAEESRDVDDMTDGW
jgi:hypothetical protein